jgi:ribose transport system ATP-binding protein
MGDSPQNPDGASSETGREQAVSEGAPHAPAAGMLSLAGVEKSFGGVQALRGASLTCRRGEVHALIGENGAGKSTLVKVLAGAARPDSGSISLDGEHLTIKSPGDARRAGIVTVFQELSLIPDHTVATNLFYGIEPQVRAGRIGARALRRAATETLATLGLESINPERTVRSLDLAERQLIEIAKALLRDPQVLMLDEPTSALTPDHVQWLLGHVRALVAHGRVVVFISHRLEEIQSFADHVTVFRGGVDVGSGAIGDMPEELLVELMLGRKVERFYPAKPEQTSEERNVVCNVVDLASPPGLRGVSFEIREREIVGVGGLQGQGQADLFLALFGARSSRGEIRLDGKTLKLRDPVDALRARIALIPEDRSTEGLCLSLSIRDNIALGNLDRISTAGVIRSGRERSLVDRVISSMQVTLRTARQEVSALSGGNQQKVLLGRVISRAPRLLLMFDATRGVDVGTKTEIYGLMREECARGAAILFYSTDAAELANLSDRVLVIHDGKLRAELAGEALTEERIIAASVGGGARAVA